MPAARAPWTPRRSALPAPPCRPSAACCPGQRCCSAPARLHCPLQTSSSHHRRRRWTATCRAAPPPLASHPSLTCGASGHRPPWTMITDHHATPTTPSYPTTSPPDAPVHRAACLPSHCRQSWHPCTSHRPPVPRMEAVKATAAGRRQASTAAAPAADTLMPLRPPCHFSAHWASEETRVVWEALMEGAEVDRRPAEAS